LERLREANEEEESAPGALTNAVKDLEKAEAEAMESEDNTMVNRDGDTEWIVPRWVGELC